LEKMEEQDDIVQIKAVPTASARHWEKQIQVAINSNPEKVERQSLKLVWKTYSWMRKIIQVRVYKGEKYYVAECVDLPVVSQGKTLDEAVENIREAISLHLEGEDLSELGILPDFSILVSMEVPPYAEA